MKNGNLLIAHNKDSFEIKVSGRANFEYGVPLRTFAQNLERQKIKKLTINLTDCLGMDSTFMGVLTMLALKMKKLNACVEISGISEQNRELLHGLGIDKLFVFLGDQKQPSAFKENVAINEKDNAPLDTAETVLEAHDILMQADDDNVKKFEHVSKFARQDAERLKKQQQKKKQEQ